MCKTYLDFPEFYNHPFIQSIADTERWTVSDNTKKPLDMFIWIYQQRIAGAATTDSNSLVSLQRLCEVLPNATNNTFFMDALADNFVMLDIEKTCPDDIKQELLKLPYIYGETSLSGKGYHLVFPIPDCFSEYPAAMKKTVMKEEHGYYEILLNHYVMFTRNMIPAATGDGDFEAFFRSMCAKQKDTHRESVEINDMEPMPGPDYDKIVALLMRQDYKKSTSDFSEDISKYEYGFMGFLHYKLNQILKVNTIAIEKVYSEELGKEISKKYVYSDNERAWILYTVAKERIPYRAKHDEFRDNLPWLLYLAREIIAKNEHDDSKKKKKKN